MFRNSFAVTYTVAFQHSQLEFRFTTSYCERRKPIIPRPRLLSMHLLFIIAFLSMPILAQLPSITVTDPSQWPGFSTIRGCAQVAITDDLEYDVDCGDWTCVCDHLSIAQATLESLAISLCSSNAQDVAAATSILNGFCSQLPGVTDVQPLPMVTASTTPLAGATATTTTSTCNSSKS